MDDPTIARDFEALAARLDYPMFIVTAAAGDERAGCLVGFATQCAIDPPRWAVFISDKNRTYRVAREATHLGVHVVPEDGEDLARLFGEQTGDDIDKFSRCAWGPGLEGVPMLSDCGDRFVARIVDRFDAGDHGGFVVEPIEVHSGGRGFFPFSRAASFDPGHEA